MTPLRRNSTSKRNVISGLNSGSRSLPLRERVRLNQQVSKDGRHWIKPDRMLNLLGFLQRHKQAYNQLDTRIAFDNTHLASPCVRRESRRRALFASGKAGNIKVKSARWTELSKIVCKG